MTIEIGPNLSLAIMAVIFDVALIFIWRAMR